MTTTEALALAARHNHASQRAAEGGSLLKRGRFAEAEAEFRAALQHDPDHPEARYNLGLALVAQEKLDEAVACYEQVLRKDSNHAIVLNNLAIALATQGKAEDALACFRRAAALMPNNHYLQSNYLFSLHYPAAHDPEAIFAEHLRWGQCFAGAKPHRPLDVHPERRLRVGYVSADFREHVVGRYCEGVLRAHDRAQVEVFCYSSVALEDARTQRIKALADHWRCLVPLSDVDAADLIARDQIDLLIDLSGHSASNRIPVFARKPAPIQVSHFGYPASTGLAAIAYRITDAYMDPPGMMEHLYSEMLVRMPEASWCYVPWDSPSVSPVPAQRSGEMTFAGISTLNKVTEEMLALWAQILLALPKSSMLVVTGAGRAADARLQAMFGRHGIGPERVRLIARRKLDAYLPLFAKIDIVLDTFPFTGCNTTVDALWMGVPVVTRAGRSGVSRLAVAPLVLAGLEDLVTDSPSAYVEAAVELAHDLARLRDLRGQLRDRVRRTLGDVESFTRRLETVYRELWRTYCADSGQQPAPARATDHILARAVQYYQTGRLTEAEQLCRQIVQAEPAHVHALYLLGLVVHRARRLDEAIACYREALRLRPEVAEIHFDLGAALKECGQLAEAAASYQAALRCQPNYPEAHANLADVLRDVGRPAEAEASYQIALRLRPSLAHARNNLGVLLMIQRRYAESEAVFREYLRLEPDAVSANYNLGLALEAQAKLDEAMDCFRQVLRIKPEHMEAQMSLARAASAQGAAKPDVPPVQSSVLFSMYYAASYDPDRVFAEHVRWGKQFGERAPEHRPLRPIDRDPGRRLRVGYVSGDLRHNVVGRYCEGVISAHDHGLFDIFCYSTTSEEDDCTARIKASSDHWRCIARLTDAEAAESIQNDQIDLLIDLSGHCAGNRLGVFARKPAPIQATHFGYPGSTGLLAIDYRLTNAHCDPFGQTERWHTEKLVRLPQSWWCYLPWGSPEIGPLPAERPGAVAFACACTLFKVTDEMIGLWARILAALPAARMQLVAGLGRERADQVHAVFQQHGIGPERVTLVPFQGLDDYLRSFQGVDIVLDAYPFTGCNVTADALWMGVPVITRTGPTAATRQGLSILTQVGLVDLAAATPEAYVETAVRLAHDLPRLRELRGQLRERVRRTLGDVGRFTRELESAYRDMWQAYCNDSAVPTLADALALARGHNERGGQLLGQQRFADAETAFREAVRVCPQYPHLYYNLGLALAGQGRQDEALACYEQALQIQPDHVEALNNRAIALASQGKAEEAVACYRRAAALKPEWQHLHSNLLFALLYLPAHEPEAVFAEHLRWGQQFEQRGARSEERNRGSSLLNSNRRLRIGYVSGHFYDYVVGRYCEGVFGAHDHDQFETFCYTTVAKEDERTQRIKARADHWRSLVSLTDAQAAEQIRSDGIDLLIDLAGHSAGNRLPIFAHEPAPIQVSHYGYPASTGLPGITYRITDAYSDPPGMTEHLYCEKLVRMPEACWCYVPWDSPPIRPLPARRAGAVTFASIGTLNKVTDEMLVLWAQILRDLPDSRMLVVTGAGCAGDERVRSAFTRQGVGSERITLVGRQQIDAYLRLFAEVDIVLDTYPYTGGNTTADALWMGVPVVSRAGRSYVSRLAVSALMLAGLEDLVTESSSGYAEAAVRLARDLPRLRELRGELRERVRLTLGDVVRFTRQLETVYRQLWKELVEW